MTTEVQLPQDIPPRWANSLMKWALTKPGLQTTIGKEVAVLTFTGRHTGDTYTIPVSYQRDDDIVFVVTKRVRRWWHNFEEPVEVHLRLAGVEVTGTAMTQIDDAANLEFMMGYLERRPIDAKAYGLDRNDLTRDKVAAVIPHIVVIRIELSP